MSSQSKSCPQDNKANQPQSFICNPKTGKWIKIGGKTHLDLIKDQILPTVSSQPTSSNPIPSKPIPSAMKTQIITKTEVSLVSPNKMSIKLPYQTALRAFRAMQKLHRREVGGLIYINLNKNFEYATIRSGDKGSINFPKDGEIAYHTHPDTRSVKIYHDPPSFKDVMNQTFISLDQYLNKVAIAPQISIVFTNEGIYTIEVTDPQAIIDHVKVLGLTKIGDIIASLNVIWENDYNQYTEKMMAKDVDLTHKINQLLKGIEVKLYTWKEIIKNRGLTLNIKLQELVKINYNPFIEPRTAPKPFIPPFLKPTH